MRAQRNCTSMSDCAIRLISSQRQTTEQGFGKATLPSFCLLMTAYPLVLEQELLDNLLVDNDGAIELARRVHAPRQEAKLEGKVEREPEENEICITTYRGCNRL
eukprot:TRINITY_DN9502_c0_g1_i1.p1 TRINITY_DN9502_c0_g1~~TRINITY_DN9502_c0_g1_i1.p1  ORF type:complete len:104 (-),score=5.23 TRINITY_DN9502_c0_g1_i1:304-615(-)